MVEYKREIIGAGAPPSVQSGSLTLAGDFVEVTSPDGNALDDFVLCRSLTWRPGDAAFDNESCYAIPAFRLAELTNRRMLGTVLEHAKIGTAEKIANLAVPYWAEQDLAVQDANSDPLVASRGARGIEWRLGKEVVVRTSGGFPFSIAERKAVARYFARHVDLHPQVRQALLEAGMFPGRLMIERRQGGRPSTEIITFSNAQRHSVSYPLPPHLASTLLVQSRANTTEGVGLRQALLAIARTAKPAKPSLSELLIRIKAATEQGRPLNAFLQFLTLSQQYGGELLSHPADMEKLRSLAPSLTIVLASPEVIDFNRASQLAGSPSQSPERENAARYLAGASKLDPLSFGTFRYVTFANLVRNSGNTSGWEKAVMAEMPPLADCYWVHIAAYPWSSNAFKDLGDYQYSQFETIKAWQAWDLGRAVDADWQRGPMLAIFDLENRIRRSIPSNF